MDQFTMLNAIHPINWKRRGSTPSLVQYATINAQIQKERLSPSLDTIVHADTDEDTEDESEEYLKNDQRCRSHPSLNNILQVTNIRGRVNILSLPPSKSSKLPKTQTGSRKIKKRDDRLKFCAEQPVLNVIKRSSSQGVLQSESVGTRTQQSTDSETNRRNSWCHASGTSAVAIDNKIEQAMDLVKSHLMFAVREEVEVLKEKIAELMDRINQLELENSFLRSQASQETLAQLAAQSNSTSPPAGPVS